MLRRDELSILKEFTREHLRSGLQAGRRGSM